MVVLEDLFYLLVGLTMPLCGGVIRGVAGDWLDNAFVQNIGDGGILLFGIIISVSGVLLWRLFQDYLVYLFKGMQISRIWECGLLGCGFGN
jgi:hypothetical protein